MAEGAPFTRIVLINSISSEYRYEFYSSIVRYTHIQSINGILLDGLSIEKVTDIFKKLPDHHIQMMIRYIHMAEKEEHQDKPNREPNPPPLRELPNRQSTFSMSSDAPTNRSNHTRTPSSQNKGESVTVLPLPLYILGDNHPLCKKLYRLLADEDPPSTPETPPTKRGSGSLPPTPQRINNNFYRSVSVPNNYSTNEFLSSSSLDDINESDDILLPLTARSPAKEKEIKSVRRRSCSFKGISSSDKYMQRTEVPVTKFETLPETQSGSDMDIPVVSSPISPGNLPHQENLGSSFQQQFILHLPSQDLDRLMTHLYFKSSGIYMIVIGLEDLITNPLCQFENLFYWVNLIHTYVSPEVKRMFVVGMYHRSTVNKDYVIESVRILNQILGKYRQSAKIPLIEQGYVYLFDIENSVAECQHLCSCILNCTRLFSTSLYYFAQEFHNSIFTPFKEFQKIASDIGLNNDRALMESKFAMGQRFKFLFDGHQHIHLPNGYYETLAAYSTACISRHCDGKFYLH